MTIIYRYRARDGLYCTYLCEHCKNKKEVRDIEIEEDERAVPDSYTLYGVVPGEDM